MLCDDPLVRAFRRYGYNVVGLPSPRFTPLLVLESDGRKSARPIGPLERELAATGSIEPPPITRDEPAPDLAVKVTRRLDPRVALDFLTPVLESIGIGSSVTAALGRSRSIEIAVRNPVTDRVEVGDLARYLESEIRPGSRHVQQAAEAGHLYVVTSVLKSRSVAVTTSRSAAQEAKAVASVSAAASVEVQVASGRHDDAMVTFTGPAPLGFAFQAVRIVYEDGEYTDFLTANGLIGFAHPGDQTGPQEGMLLVDDDLLDIA